MKRKKEILKLTKLTMSKISTMAIPHDEEARYTSIARELLIVKTSFEEDKPKLCLLSFPIMRLINPEKDDNELIGLILDMDCCYYRK